MVAEVVGAVEGAAPQRVALLQRLSRGGDARVRGAVASAAGSIDDPAAARLLASMLADADGGVAASAADAIGTAAARFRPGVGPIAPASPAAPTPPQPAAPPAAPPPPPPVPLAQLREGLSGALARLLAEEEVEGLQSVIGAIEALRLTELGDVLRPLALHANRAVRDKARAALRTLEIAAPTGEIAAPGNVIAEDAIPGAAPIRVLLRTTRGEVELELLPAEAPTTVARFVELVERGYFRNLKFHRVVPAFVVQGGDPRGDGYGGPGWTQRCEDNRLSYVRGTVGMALAGRDTGGSQFFITHNAQPHLDGRYTAFGRVVRGMEAVDTLLQDDVILEARVQR